MLPDPRSKTPSRSSTPYESNSDQMSTSTPKVIIKSNITTSKVDPCFSTTRRDSAIDLTASVAQRLRTSGPTSAASVGPVIRRVPPPLPLGCDLDCLVATKRLQVLISREGVSRPDRDYMNEIQNGRFAPNFRKSLIFFIADFAFEFDLRHETIYLGINYMERYLSTVKVTKTSQYRLLALTSIYLAAKFSEELNVPCAADVCVIAEEQTSVKDLKRMETKILKVLNWELSTPTPHAILFEMLESIELGNIVPQHAILQASKTFTRFFRAALLDYDFLRYRWSVIVAATICINLRESLPDTIMDAVLMKIVPAETHTISEIRECAEGLLKLETKGLCRTRSHMMETED
ncbi:hypothetical protein HDU76_004456 [Blyttiomyces sp. JEL0837]|nr:hypothetical protein HDU76_004456 [Blyttiomyces sp. JEL0837]